jgi:hypothetical protein
MTDQRSTTTRMVEKTKDRVTTHKYDGNDGEEHDGFSLLQCLGCLAYSFAGLDNAGLLLF